MVSLFDNAGEKFFPPALPCRARSRQFFDDEYACIRGAFATFRREKRLTAQSSRTFIVGAGAGTLFSRAFREPPGVTPCMVIHCSSDCLGFATVATLYFFEPRPGLWAGSPRVALRTTHGFDIPACYHDHALRHALARESWLLRFRSALAALREWRFSRAPAPCMFCGKRHGDLAFSGKSPDIFLRAFARAAGWSVRAAPAPKLIAALSSAGAKRAVHASGVTCTMRGIRVKERDGPVHHFFGSLDDETLLCAAIVILRSPDICAFERKRMREETSARKEALRGKVVR